MRRGRKVGTLSSLIAGGQSARLWCGACGRHVDLDPASLMARLGDIECEALLERARCAACGGRASEMHAPTRLAPFTPAWVAEHHGGGTGD